MGRSVTRAGVAAWRLPIRPERVHLAARFMAQSTAVVVHWFRAGQLAGDGSVELARWTGARR